MFTDTAALAIALAAVRIARRPADLRRTFGYHRFEILAAAFNAILVFLVAFYILYEAYQRSANPPEIESVGMLVIATVSMNILLQGVPKGLEVLRIETAIRGVAGVTDVHDLHVWAVTSGRNVLSAHIIVDPALSDERKVMKDVTDLIQTKFEISESTVQLELPGDELHPKHEH